MKYRKCWRCDGKGYRYWDIIDRILGDKTKCKECNGHGVIKLD